MSEMYKMIQIVKLFIFAVFPLGQGKISRVTTKGYIERLNTRYCLDQLKNEKYGRNQKWCINNEIK